MPDAAQVVTSQFTTTLHSDVIMGCQFRDMGKPSNQQATFVWTRKGDSDWTEENDGNFEVNIDTFCKDQYYCTPQNRAGSGQRGTISLSGIVQLFHLQRMIYIFIQVCARVSLLYVLSYFHVVVRKSIINFEYS